MDGNMMEMEVPEQQDRPEVSGDSESDTQTSIQNGAPVVFLLEESLFGKRKPHYTEYLKHEEMYASVGKVIDRTHMTGLQRVNGLWRIYLDNLSDKAKLITEGLNIRGRALTILKTNPFRPDYEDTTRIRVQNVPLSADDGMITRAFVLKGLDVISNNREKLRIDGKLTDCANGDRIVTVKSTSLKEPLNRFMYIGKYNVKVIHRNQTKKPTSTPTCAKCLEVGHYTSVCENEWVCMQCKMPGHKKGECPSLSAPQDTHDPQDEEFENENGEQPENDDGEQFENDDGEQSENDDGEQSENDEGSASEESEADDVDEQTQSQSSHDDAPAGSTTKKINPPVTKPAASEKHDKNKKPSSGASKGQPRIDQFVQSETPSKSRSKSVTRSPVTPPEKLHDNAKKSRHDRRREHD